MYFIFLCIFCGVFMENYIKSLIKTLYESFNYKIAELEGIQGLTSNWCSIKIKESYAEVFVFSSIRDIGSVDKTQIEENIKNQTNCSIVNVYIVYILESGMSNKLESFKYDKLSGLILDFKNNEIVYYYGIEDSALNEFQYCVNYLKSSQPQDNKKFNAVVTYSLIGINIAAYILTAILSKNIYTSDINVLIFLGAKVNSLILNGEYYRLITCMFLHGGIIHLGLNMYALYAIGPLIEKIFGRKKYLAIYFISGILSSLLSFIMSTSVSIGASGAIFGLLGASLVFSVKMKNKIGKDFMVNIITVIGINLFIGFSMPNVDNYGHLGGLIGGIISSLVFFIKK